MRRVVILMGRDGAATTGFFLDGVLESLIPSLPPTLSASVGDGASPVQTWVVVPGEDVVQHILEIPATNEKKALEALPFLLEDLVADDVGKLHFATGIAASGRRFATVISRELMHSYLETLTGRGITADILTPDYLVLAPTPGAFMIVDGSRAVIGLPDDVGLTIDTDHVGQLLPSALRAATVEDIQIAAEPTMSREISEALPGISTHTVPVLSVRQLLQTIHDRLAARVALNLRQGPFAPRRQWAFDAKSLQRALVLAVAFLVLLSAQMIASGIRNNSEAARALTTADNIARGVLPSGARLVNARTQTKAIAASLKAGSADSFLSLSESLAQSLATISGGYVQSMQYDGASQALSVGVVVPNYDSMAALRSQLGARGLIVNDGGARQSGNMVLGDLVVRQQ